MYGGAQLKFSDHVPHLSKPQKHWSSLYAQQFVGTVSANPSIGSTPVHHAEVDIRRKDVGHQKYGKGNPVLSGSYLDHRGLPEPKRREKRITVPTQVGNVTLSSEEPNLGFLPTADQVLFLSPEYAESSLTPRYYK